MLLSHEPTIRDLSSGIMMHDDKAIDESVTLRTCLFSLMEYILKSESCPTDTTNCLLSDRATAVTDSLWDWNDAMLLKELKGCHTGNRDTLCTLSRNVLPCSEK